MKNWLLLSVLVAATPVWSAPKTPPVNLVTAPVKWPTIRVGDDAMGGFNTRVAAIQYLLRGRKLFKGKVDGIYGAQTVAAVKAFQKSRGLKVDGVAGPQTLPKLVVEVKRGSRGDAVRAAQILARGASNHVAAMPNLGLAVDGVFGNSTQEAIENAQECENQMEDHLKISGSMLARDWCLMLGGTVVGSQL